MIKNRIIKNIIIIKVKISSRKFFLLPTKLNKIYLKIL